MAPLLGVRAYARHRGVSHPAVRKAISTGRLSRSVTRDERGHPRIDPAIADEEWKRTTDPAQQREPGEQGQLFPGGSRSSAPSEGETALTFQRSRAIREGWQARLAALEYQEKSGQLVSVASVKAEAFEKGRTVRDALLSIPARVAPLLVSMTDSRACEQLVQREIEDALRALSGRESDS